MLTKPNQAPSILARGAAVDMLALAAVWGLSLLLVNPLGDFPLDDDWAYGLTVKHLVESGSYRPGWVAMPLVTNVLWGSLFCIPAGFSFTALRLATFSLSFIGLVGCYLLVRDLQQPRWLALVSTLTLAFNPVYYALSNTFMTDVPYTALTTLAALFFARNLRTGSGHTWVLGTALALAAALSRQLAISVPLAFALCLVLACRFTIRNALRAAVPPLVCLGGLMLFRQWLAAVGRLPEVYGKQTGDILNALVHPQMLGRLLANNIFGSVLYLGLFLLPVLLFIAADVSRSHKRPAIMMFTIALATLVLIDAARYLLGQFCLMPLWGNIIGIAGIGPLTLRDTFILRLPHVPTLPLSFLLGLTALSLGGAALLVATLGVRLVTLVSRQRAEGKAGDENVVGAFLLLSATIYLLPCLLVEGFDRYMVPVIPLAAAGLAALSRHIAPSLRLNPRWLRFPALACLAAFAVFAVGGTRDYLAWNRVRWQALHDLMQNGQVAAQDIDGGFEFNGLYLYDPHYQPIPGKSIWWVQGDTYQIAFGDVPGYYAIKQYSYSHWVPSYVGKVVVLQKNDDAIRHYQEAVRLKPDYAEAHNDLGIALGTVGRLDEAVLQFGEALRLKPRYAEAHYNLGLVLSAKGRTDEAIGQFEQALQAKPDYAEAHCHLGLALCQQGRASEGVRQFQEALRLRPGYVDAQKNLDAALAISGGPPPGAATNR